MTRKIARIALVAVLMVGLVAMYSWGHRGHSDDMEAQPGSVSAVAHHHTGMSHHGQEEPEPEGEEAPGGLLSLLGMVLCGGMLIRIAVAFLRPLVSRMLAVLVVFTAAVAAETVRARRWPPPLRLRPTSLLLNRIAVLRI